LHEHYILVLQSGYNNESSFHLFQPGCKLTYTTCSSLLL
jgi:hypothetical protein